MRNRFFAWCHILIFLWSGVPAAAQEEAVNYDEAKMPAYTLPDPLVAPGGRRITTRREWEEKQRPYLLQLFASEVYGKMPGRPEGLRFVVRSVDSGALGGTALRRQVTVYFHPEDTVARMELLLYLPRNSKGKVPVFIGLNFAGNQTVHGDTGIYLASSWIAGIKDYKAVNHRATEASRGIQSRRWPVEELIARGYGLATAYYGDLEPDHPEGWKTGIRTTLATALGVPPEGWSAIGAWAWGLSRMMDYLQTDPSVDAGAVIVTGHSRLGKAALWAAANDPRFAAVVANESGEGGAALSRRWYGETIERINRSFPHWFAPAYKNYNGHPEQLPVDQHTLLALLAPRPLYVASAVEDRWADPKGEFLGALHAGPVYALYGRKGLGVSGMPDPEQPIGADIRYHIRSGGHDLLPYDWTQFIRFADEQVKKGGQPGKRAAAPAP